MGTYQGESSSVRVCMLVPVWVGCARRAIRTRNRVDARAVFETAVSAVPPDERRAVTETRTRSALSRAGSQPAVYANSTMTTLLPRFTHEALERPWCTGWASNPQDRSRCFLRAVRLPISPPVHSAKCRNRICRVALSKRCLTNWLTSRSGAAVTRTRPRRSSGVAGQPDHPAPFILRSATPPSSAPMANARLRIQHYGRHFRRGVEASAQHARHRHRRRSLLRERRAHLEFAGRPKEATRSTWQGQCRSIS